MTGFVDGALDPEVALGLQAHLSECPECRGQVAAERALRARLLGNHGPRPTEAFRRRIAGSLGAQPGERSFPAAWVVALAAGAGLLGALAGPMPRPRMH